MSIKNFKTTLTDKFPNIDPITEEILEKEFLNDVEKFSKSQLLKNIYELYTAFLQNTQINYRIYDGYIDIKTIIGGIVEAAFYLTNNLIFDGKKCRGPNKIKVIKCLGGYFNVVFIVSICNEKNKGNDFALRILFNEMSNPKKCNKLLTKLMKDKDYENYFVKPICVNKEFEDIKYKYHINTYWQLIPKLDEIPQLDTDEKLLDYLKAIFGCLKVLHRNDMLYRDIKLNNFMYDGEKIVLTDIDFAISAKSIIECYNTDGFYDLLKSIGIKNDKHIEIIFDNLVGLTSFVLEYVCSKPNLNNVYYDVNRMERKENIPIYTRRLIKKMYNENVLLDSEKFLNYILQNINNIEFEKILPIVYL